MIDLIWLLPFGAIVMSYRIIYSLASPLFFHLLIWPLSISYALNSQSAFDPVPMVTKWILIYIGIYFGSLVNFPNSSKTYRYRRIPSLQALKIITVLKVITVISIGIFYGKSVEGFEGNSYDGLSKKNIYLYAIDGLIRYGTIIVLFLVALDKEKLSRKNYNFAKFLFFIHLVFDIASGVSFAFSTNALLYFNKIWLPVVKFYLIWNIRAFSFRQIGQRRIFFLIIMASVLMAACYSTSYHLVILDKIFSRSEIYYFLNSANLDVLTEQYFGHVSYFIHPFLKLFGFESYSVPIGTFLLSMIKGSEPALTIGGPNTHFPVTSLILFGKFSFLIDFSFGFLFGCVLRAIQKSFVDRDFGISAKRFFWVGIFVFAPGLLVEPAAWSHSLFFVTVGTFILFFLLQFLRLKR